MEQLHTEHCGSPGEGPEDVGTTVREKRPTPADPGSYRRATTFGPRHRPSSRNCRPAYSLAVQTQRRSNLGPRSHCDGAANHHTGCLSHC